MFRVVRRSTRLDGLGIPGEATLNMELTRFFTVPLTTLDGEPRTGLDIIVRETVLMLIDACRVQPERSAAEIGWMQERIDPAIDLILIWPQRAANQARAFAARNVTGMFLDAEGEFRRLVSPSGKRVVLLVTPASGTMEHISGTSPIFDIGHGRDGAADRGADRMMDLGDLHY